jgi:hypothetical protein
MRIAFENSTTTPGVDAAFAEKSGLGPPFISIATRFPSMSIDPTLPPIYALRGQRVMLDGDLADLYRVAKKAFNQAIQRNIGRFPADFAFQLNR